METAELITRIERDLMDLSTEFTADNYTDAVKDAEDELGWSMPQTDTFKLKWLRERAKRNLFFNYRAGMLAADQQINQTHLEQPFEHFTKIIGEMDKEFTKAIDENLELFAGVDVSQLFGTKINAGFVYDAGGEDVTDYQNSTSIYPSAED